MRDGPAMLRGLSLADGMAVIQPGGGARGLRASRCSRSHERLGPRYGRPVSTVAVLQLPERSRGPLGSIAFRIGIALACVGATTLLVYLERDGYRDSNGTPISVLDALYYATVTLSTTGYGDIVPVTEQARLVNVLLITPLRFVFLITLVGTTVEVLTQRSRDEFRANRWRQNGAATTP